MCDEYDDETDITLRIDPAHIFASVDDHTLGLKLANAQFVPYEQVILESSPRTVIVSRTELVDAVKAVAVSASDRTNGVSLTLAQNAIKLTAEDPENGEATDEVTAKVTGDGKLTVGVSSRYLLDALEVVDGEEVELALGDELAPIVVRAAHGGQWTGVLMPMRI